MELTQQEQEMVQSMRYAEQSQKSTELDPKAQLRMGMVNGMEGMLNAAMQSHNPEVREQAERVYSTIQEVGGMSSLNDNQLSTVVKAAKEAVGADNTLQGAYEYMKVATVTYNNETDESFSTKEAEIIKESRNSYAPEKWETLTNPVTGNLIQQNNTTGEYRAYQDVEDDIEDAMAESDIAFYNYINSGGKAEDFGTSLNGDDSLVNV